MSTLDDVVAEITAWDANRPRSRQSALGASQMFSCRASVLLRLCQVEPSNPRLSWQALVGTAIHSVAEQAAPPEIMTEKRFQYRGVWATLDRSDTSRYDPAKRVVTDLKTKDNAAKIMKVRKEGPTLRQKAQVHIQGAALIEAGYDVERVELLFLPRAGDLKCAYLWGEPFDREMADMAADWAEEQNTRALWETAETAPAHLDDLRDEDDWFCQRFCEYVGTCKGLEPR